MAEETPSLLPPPLGEAPASFPLLSPPRGQSTAPERERGAGPGPRPRPRPPPVEGRPGGRVGSLRRGRGDPPLRRPQITGGGAGGQQRRRHPSQPPHLHIFTFAPGSGQSAGSAADGERRSPAAAAAAPACWWPAGAGWRQRPPAARFPGGGAMVCGGFACSKNCLCALNLLYTLVSLLLIGIAAWGIGFGLISSFRVVGVAIAVGIFLFLIALVGLIGAVKHHQVLLFFYMIILLLVFIVQFSVSCACLALNKEQQSQLLEVGWNNTNSARTDIERNLNCCGFRVFDLNETCSSDCFRSRQCQPCAPIIEEYSGMVLRFVGGIGLFFSFTEILGVWLTYRYRNQKDPRANPSAFL